MHVAVAHSLLTDKDSEYPTHHSTYHASISPNNPLNWQTVHSAKYYACHETSMRALFIHITHLTDAQMHAARGRNDIYIYMNTDMHDARVCMACLERTLEQVLTASYCPSSLPVVAESACIICHILQQNTVFRCAANQTTHFLWLLLLSGVKF